MMDVQTKKNPEVAAAKVKAGNTEEQLLWETYTAVWASFFSAWHIHIVIYKIINAYAHRV